MAPNMHVESFSIIEEFTKIKVEPVGKWFAQFQENKINKNNILKFSTDPLIINNQNDESSDDLELEDNSTYLKKLNPKDWKNQDHYAVLGLKKKRHLAKDEEIKKAYRKIVLMHHPDKRRGAGESVKDLDHDYFSCITRAYEILGNISKRQSYDSVDPEFDDDIPLVNNHSKEKFYEVFRPVFESNARWSLKQPVPSLGNKKSSFEEVDTFYSFWYDFESWREFSYLDEEEKDKGENREERKWIEKQNRVARQKHKKDEMARIRQLVDNAYSCDPRIIKFKEEEKKRKIAQKKAKEEALKLKIEEEKKMKQRALEEEQKQKEKEDEEIKQKKEKEKKEKEALKKQHKRERKLFQQVCEKNSYFASDEETKISHLKEVDKLCNLLSLQKLQDLNVVLQSEEGDNKKSFFLKEVQSLNKKLEEEKEMLLLNAQRSSSNSEDKASLKPWSPTDLQLLVKGVNLFPAGTNNRWEVIVTFMAQHSTSNVKRTAKEVLAKAKELQKRSGGLREQINKNAYENLEKNQKQVPITVGDQSAPTERFDAPAADVTETWTAEEQQLLEQALKTYPASTEERWEKIASCIPERDKKDCIKRYKDLVEMVKAKKAAQGAVGTSNSKK